MVLAAKLEKRTLAAEVRAKGRRLEGYAATFDNETDIGGRFVESIAQGAFAASLRDKNDILALVDHNPSKLLARTRSGTLRLSEDNKGLAFDLDIPNTQAGNDILSLAERGDLGGMSFGFKAIEESMTGEIRELMCVDLVEISVVQAFPAYDNTTVNARKLDHPDRFFIAYAKREIELMEMSAWGY